MTDKIDLQQDIAESLIELAECNEQMAMIYRKWADGVLCGEITAKQLIQKAKEKDREFYDMLTEGIEVTLGERR